MFALSHDLRDAWRGLRRDRLYALAVVGTLALTLGASIAVFSIVNGVLLRPLSYVDPQALVSLREILPEAADRYPTLPVTMRHFDIWRDRATAFASLAAMDWRTSTLTGVGDATQVVVLRSSGTLFDVLRIPTKLGRGLTRKDEDRDRPAVTVISEQLWRDSPACASSRPRRCATTDEGPRDSGDWLRDQSAARTRGSRTRRSAHISAASTIGKKIQGLAPITRRFVATAPPRYPVTSTAPRTAVRGMR